MFTFYSDPSVLRQSLFEGTFLTALQVLHRIIVEYDIRKDLCQMGIMKMVKHSIVLKINICKGCSTIELYTW